MGDQAIRIVIADDNAIVRRGLRVFIELHDDFELVGEASNGSEAVELCRQLSPDLVLMDLVMPVMNGIQATETIRSQFPSIQIVILTSTVEMELVTAAMSAGAHSYMIKTVTIDRMASTIRAAIS